MQRRNALEGRNVMIPTRYIHEQFVLERVQERQREAQHEQKLAGLQKPYGIVRYFFYHIICSSLLTVF